MRLRAADSSVGGWLLSVAIDLRYNLRLLAACRVGLPSCLPARAADRIQRGLGHQHAGAAAAPSRHSDRQPARPSTLSMLRALL